MNMEFFNICIEETLSDIERTPTDTVIEFIKVYNKWAKFCHNLVKADRTKLDVLARVDSEARRVLQRIFNKYCTSKNRRYHRTNKGYFFYGGTYNSSFEIVSCKFLTESRAEIETTKINNVATAKKYIVVRRQGLWKIDSVESLEGTNKWIPDIL